MLLRVVLKALLLFTLCNLVFAVLSPLEALGRLSLYNLAFPGRPRLPYGENPAQSYNLSLDNIPALFASHTLARPKADDEFRLLLLGDSGVWGWFLPNSDTLAARINTGNCRLPDGRRLVAYNLGYPVMSLTKDLLLLDAALAYQPDAVIWLVTLESFPRAKQTFPSLVQHNPQRLRTLISAYDLNVDPADSRFVEADLWGRTIIGQRRALADLLRLQLYGFSWAATGLDQYIPAEIPLRQSDFEADVNWQGYTPPTVLGENDLAFDALRAAHQAVGTVPLMLINEPIFISQGTNSDLRYNAWYPRWAYDQYRGLFAQTAQAEGWDYLDLWDAVAPDEFTDSPVHLTAAGEQTLAELMVHDASSNPSQNPRCSFLPPKS